MTQTIFSDEPAKGWIASSIAAPFICIFLVAISSLPLDFWFESLGLMDAKGTPQGPLGFCIFLASFISIGLAVFAWMHWIEKRSLASAGLRGDLRSKRFLIGLAIGLAMMGATVTAIAIAGGYRVGDLFPAFQSAAALGWIGLLLAGFTVQASVEEFVFRGWLLSAVMRRWNAVAAFVLTSAAFTFLHFSPGTPLLDLVMTFAFSVFACAWARRSNSIWGVMGWHTGWNWLGGVGFGVPITGLDTGLPALIVRMVPSGPAWLNGGAEGPEGSVFTLALLIAGSLILLWPGHSRKSDGHGAAPSEHRT